MRKSILIPFLFILILVSGCAGSPGIEEPPVDLSALNGSTWMWTAMTTPIQQSSIDVPQNYTLEFQDEGIVKIKADCNHASGIYKINDQKIQIEIGPVTMAACPPGSLSSDFIQYLESAAIYFFKDGDFYIDLAADGGTMAFAPYVEKTMAATETPVSDPLLANPWQWTSFINPVEKYTVESPENYQVTFHEDGSLDIKADCNLAGGSYTTSEKSISITIGPTTLAACPPGSRSDEFIKRLGYAAIYFFQDEKLFLDLFADGGTMGFTAVE
jgi:heat shock protein HslJ